MNKEWRNLICLASFLLACSGCHLIFPFDTTSPPDGGGDAARLDSAFPEEMSSGEGHAPDGPGDAAGLSERVPGPVVLYLFDEGSGSTVKDRSGVSPTLDLTILQASNVTWSPGKLEIHTETSLVCGTAPSKVLSRLTKSKAFTIEAWIQPASAAPAGLARIVAFSFDQSSQNFVLGHGDCDQPGKFATYCMRRRTSLIADNAGKPCLCTPLGAAKAQLTHVVYTRTAAGDEALHLDGVSASSGSQKGDLSNWSSSHRLILGSEYGADRFWFGTYHLVAIYDWALTPAEITKNYKAGPDPELP
jgi:hypothetical protein